jgi:DNA-binding NarL/FixJ family response regulator
MTRGVERSQRQKHIRSLVIAEAVVNDRHLMHDSAVQHEPFTMVIAAAHPLLRLGIRARLEGQGFDVVAEAGSADEAVDAVRHFRPRLALLDVWLPGGGLEAGRRAQASVPGIALAFLVSNEDNWLFVDAVRTGATGVIFKDMDPERLGHALRDVAMGGTALPRALVRQLLDELLDPHTAASA